MNPDFASLPADATVAQALSAVRGSELEPGQLLTLWVIEADGHLASGVLASELLRSAEQTTVSELIENAVPAVSPETELPRGGGAGRGSRGDRPRPAGPSSNTLILSAARQPTAITQVYAMDEPGLYPDSELPRSSRSVAAVVNVRSRPEGMISG